MWGWGLREGIQGEKHRAKRFSPSSCKVIYTTGKNQSTFKNLRIRKDPRGHSVTGTHYIERWDILSTCKVPK